MMTSCLLLHQ
jgi:ATP-dependent Clp protease, protease subunit